MSGSYVYIHSEHTSDHDLYTVGFYDPAGRWQPESDHPSEQAAAQRVHWLNGGNQGTHPTDRMEGR